MGRTPEITHKIMASIKSKDTEPELILRRGLWHTGLRYKVNCKQLPGKPDIVFSRAKVVVFCDGDFWHGHNWALRGLSSLEEELERYSDFWKEKILRNIERDKLVTRKLEMSGWLVIRLWESDIRENPQEIIQSIIEIYQKRISSVNLKKEEKKNG